MPSAGPANGTTAKKSSTADHTKFDSLHKQFASGPEVTKACLACHTEAAKQVQKTKHWTWEVVNPETGRRLGKRYVLNNFCGTTQSNEKFCTKCHAGYGFDDQGFDFTAEANVDCLVCHDTTGTYEKTGNGGRPRVEAVERPAGSGNMVPGIDLRTIAQNVGPTSRRNCGTCHFFGGGGNAVKHGDLDASLTVPAKYLDVHMSPEQKDFSCSTCHNTDAHSIKGSRYTPEAKDKAGRFMPGRNTQRATCESCHGDRPMKSEKLNDHTDKIACPTCHVPAFARGGYFTKMWWDWSTAGENEGPNKPVKRHDKRGLEVYSGIKGDFQWGEHVKPEYRWFNGKSRYTLPGDRIDDTQVVRINQFGGAPDDPDSRIWPFKVMRGKQAYDPVNKTLAVVHTTQRDASDTDSFWVYFDYGKAITAGMKAVNQPFSGSFGFVETEMAWPITHMVAPVEDTVRCEECHTKDDGRLKDVAGVYMPGRDSWWFLDIVGYLAIVGTFLGTLGHGALRVFMHYRRNGNGHGHRG